MGFSWARCRRRPLATFFFVSQKTGVKRRKSAKFPVCHFTFFFEWQYFYYENENCSAGCMHNCISVRIFFPKFAIKYCVSKNRILTLSSLDHKFSFLFHKFLKRRFCKFRHPSPKPSTKSTAPYKQVSQSAARLHNRPTLFICLNR